jgi:APA family basic amino acid/polyamine antiporter
MQLFKTKPIEPDADRGLIRSLGAGDLILLGIGAVIGAGIFASLGTAAAGEIGPNGEMIRAGAGPALVFSFILLGVVCGLAALCYSELAAMIPQAGSAYAYTYATLGELAAWVIGWALVLEYAVGNVAVAVAWSGYFTSMLSGWGIHFPDWLTHGYYQVSMSGNPEMRALLDTAPNLGGMPVLLNLPAALITLAVTAVFGADVPAP